MSGAAVSRSSLMRDTAANLVGALAPAVVLLVTVPGYLRIIGGDRYGVLSLVWALLGYFGLFDLGFGRAIASRIATLEGKDPKRQSQVLWTGTILSVLTGAAGSILLLGLGHYIFSSVFEMSPELRSESQEAMPLIAASLPVATCISALSGALQGRRAFVSMNIAQTAGMVMFQVLPLLAALWISVSLPCLVAAAIIGRLVTAVMLLASCRREFSDAPLARFALSEVRSMMVYGGWVTVTGIISPMLVTFDRFAIGTLAGMNAVTAYIVPYNLVTRVSALPVSWQGALFPRFAMITEAASRRLLARGVEIQALMMTPIAVVGILLTKPFLLLWVGADLATRSAPIGQILFAGLWFNALAYIPYSALQSRGRPDIPAKFHVLELFIYAPALWLLIGWVGLTGAAWAWTLRVALDAFLMFAATRALGTLARARWGLAWVSAALVWALLNVADPKIDYGVGALLLTACAVWTWFVLPADISAAMLGRLRGFKEVRLDTTGTE